MSDTQSRFEIEIDEETAISRDDMVEHVEHGPMFVDRISVGAGYKKAHLQSDRGPVGLELTDDQLRDEWGETVHFDPTKLYTPGHTRDENEFESTDGEVQVTISASGPEDRTEVVMCHMHDQVARVLESLEEGHPPDESKGVYKIDWEAILADIDRVEEGDK